MRLLIDGYNVVAPIAAPGRRIGHVTNQNWLQRERMLLIKRLSRHLPAAVRNRTCVVFDAVHPPTDRPDTFRHEGIEIRFAVEHPEADDLIEELIVHHSAPKQLIVVSSDRRVKNAAKKRGCETFDSQEWLDKLLDGKLRIQMDAIEDTEQGRGVGNQDKPTGIIDADEVDQWMQDFGFDEH